MDNNEVDQLTLLRNIEMKLDRIEQGQLSIAVEKLDMAQLALDLRRERDAVFPSNYFSDSMWDILLELYQAHQSGRKMPVSLVGCDAKIAKSITSRYLDILMQDGLVYEENDPSDNSESYARITSKAQNLMEDLFGRFQTKIVQQSRTFSPGNTTETEYKLQAQNAN